MPLMKRARPPAHKAGSVHIDGAARQSVASKHRTRTRRARASCAPLDRHVDDALGRLRNAWRMFHRVRDTVPMGDLVPPDPPLAGVQVALRPFRVGDAAVIAES